MQEKNRLSRPRIDARSVDADVSTFEVQVSLTLSSRKRHMSHVAGPKAPLVLVDALVVDAIVLEEFGGDLDDTSQLACMWTMMSCTCVTER